MFRASGSGVFDIVVWARLTAFGRSSHRSVVERLKSGREDLPDSTVTLLQ